MVWYDYEMKKVQDIIIELKYSSQCWGLNLQYIKRPHDFTFSVMFDLKGITKGFRI
jgi:hypothetical protein